MLPATKVETVSKSRKLKNWYQNEVDEETKRNSASQIERDYYST